MRNLLVVAILLALFTGALPALGQENVNFNGDIRPILSAKCFACHGPSEGDRKGDLRLDVPGGADGALTPREGSFNPYIIKPGDIEESELWHRLITDDEDELMPPPDSHKEPLTDDELDLMKRWIEAGAEYQAFWSFIPPEKTTPPQTQDSTWNKSLIDRHVKARLEQEGIEPKEEADKRTLLRRVTFDLTGLPPTLEEIDAFLSDDRPDAYERVVYDLLQRKSYGEHMTRYWADLVRLADTNGMHKDFNRDFTTYRDWLIRSFNANMPYDEFVKYQVAGDLFDVPTKEQLVASGFNRLHLIIDRGTALPEESLHKNIVDRVQAFGTVFLGLTAHCAQCHDHKTDPMTQKEYFQLYAFFNNFDGEPETTRAPARGLQPPYIHLANNEQQEKIDAFDAKMRQLSDAHAAKLDEFKKSTKWQEGREQAAAPWVWQDVAPEERKAQFRTSFAIDGTPGQALARFSAATTAKVTINGKAVGRTRPTDQGVIFDVGDYLSPGENEITVEVKGEPGFVFQLDYQLGDAINAIVSGTHWEARATDEGAWKSAVEITPPDQKKDWVKATAPPEVSDLAREIDKIEKEKNAFLSQVPAAMVMREKKPPRPATLLIRGMYDAPGEPVQRNTPAFLPAMAKKDTAYTRMDLAEWLVEPSHPLTARVAVNRFWQQFFGVGLVKTSEDFGSTGEWPSHPALLDDLAIVFMESGWNVKELMRIIVLSNTYKQSSNATMEEYVQDPENRLLARGSRYRMDAEMIRDLILAVSGKLNRTMYGRSVKPPQPPGLWEMVSMAEPKTYVADTDDNVYRRSLYTYWRRGMPPPQMTILNAPSREFCIARRERTNTPLQALLLMNEQAYFDAAKACVQSTLTPDMNAEEGLSRIYEKITSHVPSPERLQLMEQTLNGFKELYANDPALTEALTADQIDTEFQERVRLAAWTMVTHGLMNLELTKVRK